MPQVVFRLRRLHALTTLFAERCKNFTMTRGGDCEAGGAGRWDGISLYETCQNLLRLVRITITTGDLVNYDSGTSAVMSPGGARVVDC